MVRGLRETEYGGSSFYIVHKEQLIWEGILKAICYIKICHQNLRLCDFKIFYYCLSYYANIPFLLILLPRKIEKNNSSTDVANFDFGKQLLLLETVACEAVGKLEDKYPILVENLALWMDIESKVL